MKKICLGICLYLLLFFPAIGHAAITGEQLLRACTGNIKNPQEGTGKAFCLGYLSGYLDSYMISSEVHTNDRKLFCLPAQGISSNEASLIVIEYLQKNPAKLQQSARSSIILAFIQKFPCKNGQK